MNTYKKTIFLSNKTSTNKGMAILTLAKQNQGVFCTIKAYNFAKYPNAVLGIKTDKKIYKQNVNLENNIYNFFINQVIDLSQDIGCVLMDTSNNSFSPILWGSEKQENYKSQIINNLRENIQKLEMPKPKQTSPVASNSPSEKIIPSSPTPANLGECYHPYGHKVEIKCDNEQNKHSQEIAQVATLSNLFESSDEEIEQTIDKELNESKREHKFYNMIASQLDELFDKYPREENLENLVENSKWVKIKYDDSEKFYVVGLIYFNNDIKYICYGVPGDYNSEPPRELREYSQWLPTDAMQPYTQGFWVMYQDADTGENIIIN